MEKNVTASHAAPVPESAAAAPIIIDLGRKKRKQIKALRQGKGRLVDSVLGAMSDLKKAGHVSESSQPVVVVVQQRRKNSFWG